MTNPLLNLDAAPKDPVERAMWLTGVMDQARKELEQALAEVYYDARLQGVDRFDAAVRNGPYAKSRALALTRRENRARGRNVRWNDRLDPTSSAYEG